MLKTVTTLLPLVALALGAPAPQSSCTPTKESKVAKFDDLPFNEPGPNPIPPHYYGLSYFTFQVDQSDGFITPASGNQWTMAFGGSGNISIPDSPPKSTFELESFSYACDSGIPQPACDISVWGWKSNGKVIKRVIRYPALNPAPVGSYIMNKTSFSREWHDIKSLGFSIARADNGGDMFGGLALDDIKYTITFGCP